jgi:hypothetical protein
LLEPIRPAVRIVGDAKKLSDRVQMIGFLRKPTAIGGVMSKGGRAIRRHAP